MNERSLGRWERGGKTAPGKGCVCGGEYQGRILSHPAAVGTLSAGSQDSLSGISSDLN